MPRDPTTGVFTRPNNSFSEPADGTLIEPGDATSLFDDYDTGLDAASLAEAQAGTTNATVMTPGRTADYAAANILPATLPVVDNTVPRFDGTGGRLQGSGVTISDANLLSAAALAVTGSSAPIIGVYTPSANTLSLAVSSTPIVTIRQAGASGPNLLVANNFTGAISDGAATAAGMVAAGTGADGQFWLARFSGNTNPPRIQFMKSLGATINSQVQVTVGTELGAFDFKGSNGTSMGGGGNSSARINVTVENSTFTTNPAAYISFWTSPADSPLAEALRVESTGDLLVTNIVAPATPAGGRTSIYVDSTNKRLHDKNDAGTIGTTVVADTGASNNFLTAISTSGVISKAQPSISNLSGFGTGIATALAVNVGTDGAPVVKGGALGTPSSGVGTNITGLPAANLTGQVAIANGGTSAATAQAAMAALKGVYILGASAVAVPHTGDTSLTTLATITVPANAMGANGVVRVTTQWSHTGSAGNWVSNTNFGGTTYITQTQGSTTTSARLQTQVANRNATNSQVGTSIGQGNWSSNTGATVTSAVDTTSSTTITIQGSIANSGDTVTLESYLVELIVP